MKKNIWRENYKIIVDGWNCDWAIRMDEAFKKASEWVKMGHTNVAVVEILTNTYFKHNPARTDRF